MANGTKIESPTTPAQQVEVNAAYETALALSSSELTSGYMALTTEVDEGLITGTRLMRDLHVSEDYRTRVGIDTVMYSDFFPGSALNSAVWTSILTTMTATVGSGWLTLNAGSSNASAAVAQVRTYRHFPLYANTVTYMEATVQFPITPVSSNVTEWGLGLAATTAAPTDGVFFRIFSTGEVRGVLNTGGVETFSQDINFLTALTAGVSHHCVVAVFAGSAIFWVDDQVVARIPLPWGGPAPVASGNLPIFFRTYNTGVSDAPFQMKIGMVGAGIGDIQTGKPWSHIMCGMGGHASQGQTGATMGKTALWTNNANPTATLPTNNTAALGTGLGGNFWSLTTLTPGTDGIISDYTVPAGTVAIPGKTLYITGILVDTIIQAAVTLGAGPMVLQWGLAYGATNVDLATAESAVAKAARTILIGMQQFTVGTVGTKGGAMYMPFASPVAVQPGEHVQVIYRNIGLAGSAGTLAHVIAFDGYWE